MAKVSAVLITFNEEADVARALESVSWCDEIVVVDSGSIDATVAICQAHGCRVLHRPFSGYGEQKAFAVMQAANDWVFNVDADEEVTPGLETEIRSSLDAGDCRGFYIPITTILWDQVVRLGARHTKVKLRLFDRRRGNFQKQLVHESVRLDGATRCLRHGMFNHSYANIADYFEKFNRYTSAAALECFSHGKRSSFLGVVARLPLTFFQFFFLKGFWRDGSTGLTWSLFSAFYPAVKQLKLLELWRGVRAPAAIPVNGWLAVGKQPEKARSARPARARPYFLTTCCVVLALFLLVRFGPDMPGNYSVLLLACVAASALLWGLRPALVAIALALLGLDYFTVEPLNEFSWPDRTGLIQLSIFAVLSLLITILIYDCKRQTLR